MTLKVGITFDLKDTYIAQGYSEVDAVEFDSEETIVDIEQNLRRQGFATERIGNAKDLIGALSRGCRWDLVFNVCEGMHGTGREALVPAILDCYEIPYTFSDPLALTLTLHKYMAKCVMRDAGIATSPFALVERLEDVDKVDLHFPLFAKPVAEGTSKGIDASCYADTPEALHTVCRHLLETFRQPALVEGYLPGREFTVGVIGSGPEARLFGGMEILPREVAEPYGYTLNNKARWETLVDFRGLDAGLQDACSKEAVAAWRALRCRDAGRVDLREDAEGRVNVIEINPLPGLNAYFSDLAVLSRLSGISYEQLFDMIMDVALRRLELPFPAAGGGTQAASVSS